MAQYINKSDIETELTKRMLTYKHLMFNATNGSMQQYFVGQEAVCGELLSFLQILEVKEVDLNKEIEKYFLANADCLINCNSEEVVKKLAAYFFELGLNSKIPNF